VVYEWAVNTKLKIKARELEEKYRETISIESEKRQVVLAHERDKPKMNRFNSRHR